MNRQSFLEKFRQNSQTFIDEEARLAIHNLVLNEWSSFQNDTRQPGDLVDGLPSEDVDAILSVFDEITQELLDEEQKILAQYEADNRHDEASLCSAVEHLISNEVICPICQKSPLFINKGIVFCNCGVRIDTEQDAVTLDMVRLNLDEGLRQHSLSCHDCPSFGVVSHVGICNMLMTCEACDFMYIIV